MKKIQFLLMTAAIAAFMMGVSTFTACDKDDDKKEDNTEQTDNAKKGDESKSDKENGKQDGDDQQNGILRGIPQSYVDLGLPSGTLWKDQNESGFYDYDVAVAQFGDKLPTKEQLKELKESCQWQLIGSGYKVTGPNGNSITLPAAGYRDCDGFTNFVGSYGYYWSSTPRGSGDAWSLRFYSSSVRVYSDGRCSGRSVRLVQ